MKVYTFSEARQQLPTVLNTARRDGEVRIRRGDGQEFVIQPLPAGRPEVEYDVDVEIMELPYHADADWRWMEGRDESPWYPTMRLFRQERPGEWEPVIARVAAELRNLGSVRACSLGSS